MPYGIHGVFAALPLGVVFALQGFEQAVQLAGEARDPKKDMSRAIIVAMAIGGTIYILLQFVFIAAVNPVDIAQGWTSPLGPNASADQGAWHTLAVAVGAGWLAAIIVIDGVVSPAGTGIVYVGTSARLSYALGEEREMPAALASVNKKGTPGRVDSSRVRDWACCLRAVPVVEQAGQRGDRNDRDHVRVCPGLAGCAA